MDMPENINDPDVQSVLYDLDLLPEQIDAMSGPKRFIGFVRIRAVCLLMQENSGLKDALEKVYTVLTDDWAGLTPEECRKAVLSYISERFGLEGETDV